jgi:cysteine desulfurase / selenocysteine lyase
LLETTSLVNKARNDFPSLKAVRKGHPPIYLDSACTTLVPHQVIESINEYYTGFPGCAGARSRHWFAQEVNDRIEGNPEKGLKGSRTLIKEFINADSEKDIIFTQNTSHAINLVALGFKFSPGDTVLLTDREHNSNLLPWLRLQKKGVIKVERIRTSGNETFDLDALEQKLKKSRVALVSMAYTSNITGYTLPAEEIIKLAHAHGARVFMDAAQTAAHRKIDTRELDIDFLAFSMHKLCGPRGAGVLYARSSLWGHSSTEQSSPDDYLVPVILGGGAVNDSTYNDYTLHDSQERFEIGIQDYPGQIAAGAAVNYIQRVGFDKISHHVGLLNTYLTEELLKRYGDTGWFHIIGPQDPGQRGGILTFEVQRPNAVGIADELSDRKNIMIRDGVFCVHSYFNYRYGAGWIQPRLPSEHRMIYRVSLYFYNTVEECRIFLKTLEEIFKERSYID